MRVRVVSAVFPPEPTTSASTSRDIVCELERRGHSVTVLCPFPNRPAGRLHAGFRRAPVSRRSENGRLTVRTWHTLSRRSSALSRGAENVSFGLTSSLAILFGKRADAAYLGTWPIAAQLLNALALRARGTPFVCAVKDLYPESRRVTGATTAVRLVSRFLRALDAVVYRLAARVTTLTTRQAEAIIRSRGVPPAKVVCVPDWVRGIDDDPEGAARFRAEQGIGTETFAAVFAGTLSGTAGLGVLLDCASILGPHDKIEILLVGDGAEREDLAAAIEQRGLENIRILTPLNPEDLPAVQSAADALLLSLRPGSATSSLPSKLVAYLPSTRLVVAIVDQESAAADLVRESGCGVVTPAGDAAALAQVLQRLAADPDQCRVHGAAARKAADQFRPERALPVVCDLLEDLSP